MKNRSLSVLESAFGGLVELSQIERALADLTGSNLDHVELMRDFEKRVEAARKYDSDTTERITYWGKVAIIATQHFGRVITEGQKAGTISKRGKPEQAGKCDTMSHLGIDRKHASRAKQLAGVADSTRDAYFADCLEAGDAPTKSGLQRSHVSKQTNFATKLTGNEEWYTPAAYVESARKVMGSIDLDPASCDFANKVVKAKRFFTKDENGQDRKWRGNVWLNPPYTSDLIKGFTDRLCDSFKAGQVSQAVFLTHNNTDAAWWHKAAGSCQRICLTRGRVKFYDGTGTASSPTHGHCFIYFGSRPELFVKEFSQYGSILYPFHEVA